jgi:hypothetical protein
MLENTKDVPNKKKQKIDEICALRLSLSACGILFHRDTRQIELVASQNLRQKFVSHWSVGLGSTWLI